MTDTAASSIITDHPFASAQWWSRCPACGLSAAAHREIDALTEARMREELRALPYRCPVCATPPMTECEHGRPS
jgi:hypothetical protein